MDKHCCVAAKILCNCLYSSHVPIRAYLILVILDLALVQSIIFFFVVFSFKDDFSQDWGDVSVTKCAFCSCKKLVINFHYPHGVTTTTCNYSSKAIKHSGPLNTLRHMNTCRQTKLK